MRKETTITVKKYGFYWDLESRPYKKISESTIVPITYCLPKEKAIIEFLETKGIEDWKIVSIQENEVETFFDLISNFFKKNNKITMKTILLTLLTAVILTATYILGQNNAETANLKDFEKELDLLIQVSKQTGYDSAYNEIRQINLKEFRSN